MRGHALCLVVLAVLVTATGTAVATDNTPPLAAAGVDQTVTPGTTVYLDANGSTDPDGEITSVDWTIETPGGTTQTPDCGTCRQTEFEATTVGQYTVTLSVTDDDGATRSDTLYVTVESEDGPSVSLSGPETATRGSSTTLTATADEANASLESLSWVVDGEVVSQDSVSGDSTSSSFTNTFTSTGDVSVSVVVYDTLGYRGSAARTVNVEDGGGGNGGGGPSRCDTGDAWDGLCNGGADATITADGNTYLLNSNGREGFQTVTDSGVVSYTDLTESQYISTADGTSDTPVIEDGVTVETALEDAGEVSELGSDSSPGAGDSQKNIDRGEPPGSGDSENEPESGAGVDLTGDEESVGGGGEVDTSNDDNGGNDGGSSKNKGGDGGLAGGSSGGGDSGGGSSGSGDSGGGSSGSGDSGGGSSGGGGGGGGSKGGGGGGKR